MMALKIAAAVAAAYLLGSISSAVVTTKLTAKIDIRRFGSGNAGATNVARVMGMGMGLLTLAGDILKTAAAMFLGRLIAGEAGFLAAAAACLVGHCFPLYFHFRGGKGVSVGAGIALMLSWRVFLMLAALFFVVFFLTWRVSAASLSDAVTYPLAIYIVFGADAPRLALGFFILVVVIFMHRSNIKRLLNGTEQRFSAKTKKKGGDM